MKRHPSLRSLSSEHHSGLVLARRARKAADQDTSIQAATWKAIQLAFQSELEPHFQREEQGLLPVLRTAGEVELVNRTLHEHRSMRLLVLENNPDKLASFAELLRAHIRFEEKELFETAQRVLGSNVLKDLEGA
ncbi:MAG: hemerythrin domain-containing protein [Gammaproteobacteria bacterium]|nr:hemerythrin domain-containing protein [Gammaproteobacteria bacterium]